MTDRRIIPSWLIWSDSPNQHNERLPAPAGQHPQPTTPHINSSLSNSLWIKCSAGSEGGFLPRLEITSGFPSRSWEVCEMPVSDSHLLTLTYCNTHKERQSRGRRCFYRAAGVCWWCAMCNGLNLVRSTQPQASSTRDSRARDSLGPEMGVGDVAEWKQTLSPESGGPRVPIR